MLSPLIVAILWVTGLTGAVNARTVHSSVVITRAGDRTPLLDDSLLQLTSLGAQELYSVGSTFRQRYLSAENADDRIRGLSMDSIPHEMLHIMTRDLQYMTGSAQAFLQALYPPLTVGGNATADDRSPATLEETSILANGSYVENPLNGYQYPRIRSVSLYDPNSVFIAGDVNCANHAIQGTTYYATDDYANTEQDSRDLYRRVGEITLADFTPSSSWGYFNAYAIYDYVRYQFTHNGTVARLVSQEDLDQLRWLADRHEWAMNGGLSADDNEDVAGDYEMRSMAGRTLAAKIFGLLAVNIDTQGARNKLSLLFGDHEPFLAFFALTDLHDVASGFRGLPAFGSSMVFELFSNDDLENDGEGSGNDGDPNTYPSTDDLWVRFLFRNGSAEASGANSSTEEGTSPTLQAYPLFGRPRVETDMPWRDFASAISSRMVGNVSKWCAACSSTSIFCAAYNDDSSSRSYESDRDGSDENGSRMTNRTAGVLGAVATLGTLLVALVLAVGCGGVRFTRVKGSRRRSELGGFKGGRKMASDQDLVLPKGGARSEIEPQAKGVDVPPPVLAAEPKGHERVGSWELKEGEGKFASVKDVEAAFGAPVKADERV